MLKFVLGFGLLCRLHETSTCLRLLCFFAEETGSLKETGVVEEHSRVKRGELVILYSQKFLNFINL